MPNILVVFAPASGSVVTPPHLLDVHIDRRKTMTGQSLISQLFIDLRINIEHTVDRFKQVQPDIQVFIIPIDFRKTFTKETNEPLVRISGDIGLSRALLAKPACVNILFCGHGSHGDMIAKFEEDPMDLLNRIECCKLIMMPLKSPDGRGRKTHVDIYLGHCFSAGGDIQNNLLYQMYRHLAIMRLSFTIYGSPLVTALLPKSESIDAIWNNGWEISFKTPATPSNHWSNHYAIYPPVPNISLNNAFVANTLTLPTLVQISDSFGNTPTCVPENQTYLKSFTIKISHIYRGFVEKPGDPIIYDLSVDSRYPNIFETSFSILLRNNDHHYEDEIETKDDALFRLYLRIQNNLLTMFEHHMSYVTRSESDLVTNQHLAWLTTLWSVCQFHLQKNIFNDALYPPSQDKMERAKELLKQSNDTIQEHLLLGNPSSLVSSSFEEYVPIHYSGCFNPMLVGFAISQIFCAEWSKIDLYYSDSKDRILRGDRNLYTTGRSRINMADHKYPDRFSTKFAKALQNAKESQALGEISKEPTKPLSSLPHRKTYNAPPLDHPRMPEFPCPVWQCPRTGCGRYNSDDTDICAFCHTERVS